MNLLPADKCLFHHHNREIVTFFFGLLVYGLPSTLVSFFFFALPMHRSVYGWHFDNFPIRYGCFTVPSDMFTPCCSLLIFMGNCVTGSFSRFSSLRLNSSPYNQCPATTYDFCSSSSGAPRSNQCIIGCFAF